MGSELLCFYQEKIKKSWKTAFFSAFFLGLLVHLFKFTNVLPNQDALYNFYSSQNMVGSGRWFLCIACGFSSFFDLPWMIGLLSVFFMGLAAACIAEVFKMENPVVIILSSALLVSFPAITATMTFEFTADGYMLAMVLASASVCLSRIGQTNWKKMVLSGVCICLSCGIYQAYVSFAFVLAVSYFMTELLENRWENKQYWKWICSQILTYGCALAAYWIIWKLALRVFDVVPGSYQGYNNVKIMSLGELARAVRYIFRDFFLFFVEWNILEHGVTVYSVLNILFLIGFVSVILAAIWKSGLVKRKISLFLFLLCIPALPVGGLVWYLVTPDIFYHTVMLQSICVLYILTAVLFDRWISGRINYLALVVLAAIAFQNTVAANIFYNYMNQCFEKTQATAIEVSTRIHLLDDGTIQYVAFYGGLEGWGPDAYYANDKLRQLGGWKWANRNIVSPRFLYLFTDFDLSYYRSNHLEYPIVENGEDLPVPKGWVYRFPVANSEKTSQFFQTEQVKSMPIWPARDSVQVIGDTVVVKLSEIETIS